MTATCPLTLQPKIFSILEIGDNCHIIHVPTDQLEISYNIKLSPSLKDAKKNIVKAIKDQMAKKEPSFLLRTAEAQRLWRILLRWLDVNCSMPADSKKRGRIGWYCCRLASMWGSPYLLVWGKNPSPVRPTFFGGQWTNNGCGKPTGYWVSCSTQNNVYMDHTFDLKHRIAVLAQSCQNSTKWLNTIWISSLVS